MNSRDFRLDPSILCVSGLACSRGGKTLFSDLSFELRAGQLLRISGSNGAGKSSLLRILCGLLSASSGSVSWNNASIRADRDEFNRQLIYLGHTPALKGDLTAEENLVASGNLSGDLITNEMARTALVASGLGHLAGKMARTFSQGQKQRVALARLHLARHKPLWLLDEPFNALDQAANESLQTLVRDHLASGGMVALSSHQAVALDEIDQLIRINL